MNSNSRAAPAPPAAPVSRIPVTLLTGFLGAGKTTLLNHLVRQPEMSRAALLINEFGDVGVDHHLVDRVDESVMLLDSGCLCCAMQGDLVRTLKELSAKCSRREIPPIERVLIETTGLADPVPVVYTLMEDGFVAARYYCDGVITAVDATNGEGQLGMHQEAIRQVAMADRLLITKCDLASPQRREALSRRLTVLNPSAPQIEVTGGRVRADEVLGLGLYALADKSPDVAAWLGEIGPSSLPPAGSPWRPRRPEGKLPPRVRHDERVRSFVVNFDEPVGWYGFTAAMGRVLLDYGASILRVKGLIAVAGGELQPMVVHGVQGVAYPPVRLPQWPAGGQFSDRQGRLVIIGMDLTLDIEAKIRATLSDLPGEAVAARMLAASPQIPTRCWMAQRIAPASNTGLKHEGWVIQAKRLPKAG